MTTHRTRIALLAVWATVATLIAVVLIRCASAHGWRPTLEALAICSPLLALCVLACAEDWPRAGGGR